MKETQGDIQKKSTQSGVNKRAKGGRTKRKASNSK